MVQLVLDGNTLGERHRHFNKIVDEAILDKQPILEKINNKDQDLDNLFKIDVACKYKNVDYILDVLKNDDLLYASRALKHSVWLITDPQYADIINPDYLHTSLYPHMTTKAIIKLTLHIRLNLKDERRVESFYNYYKTKDKEAALKWLPNCSLSFIEKEVENLKESVSVSLIKRLCEKSITVLDIYVKNCQYYVRDALRATMFILNTNPDKYLDILETLEQRKWPNFNAKYTYVLIKKCPRRIIDNFEKYCHLIHTETFARYLKDTGVKEFLLKYHNKESMRSWFKFDNLKYFVRYMPKEGRFDFLKKAFIEKSFQTESQGNYTSESDWDNIQYCCAMSSGPTSSANIYRWYRYAPFEIAFTDLKKLIRIESHPAERTAIFGVLVTCAGRNQQHIHNLLQYYQEKHINEPFKFKIQFVNNVISQADTHSFDTKTWDILNNIFCSCEVYAETQNNVQHCVQAIIVYKVLHNEQVSQSLENKFTFDTLKSKQNKLKKVEQDKIFTYLYNLLMTKIQAKHLQTEREFAEALDMLEKMLQLLIDWNKEIGEFPWILERIKYLINVKKRNSWSADLSNLYNKKKSWRKYMFEDSLLLFPSEEVCMNALKHGPELLERYERELETLCRNDRISLYQVLSKIKIYWPNSLAIKWSKMYLSRIENPGGYKALVRGLCALLPHNEVIEIAKKYAPSDTKITWSEDDDVLLSLRIQLAKNIYLIRPLPSPEVVLLYAHGDYLQFAISSINSIVYNISKVNSREHIRKFLDAPVSLQKHGIRMAFSKLESQELKQTFSDIWKSTKNSTIRAVLIKQTFNILRGEKNPKIIEEIWELMNMFIDNLSQEEDKIVYDVLSEVEHIPLIIRGKFCMKSYKFLKLLPAKANCENNVHRVISSTRDIMDSLDSDFVSDILLEILDKIRNANYTYSNVMSSYLLCARDAKLQIEKCEKVLFPYMKLCFDSWNVDTEGDSSFFKIYLNDLLSQLTRDLQKYVFERNMVFPVVMFNEILKKLEDNLLIQRNYVLLRTWKLTTAYVKLLDDHRDLILSAVNQSSCSQGGHGCNRESTEVLNEAYSKLAPEFSGICMKYLKDDIDKYYPSVYLLFADALKDTFYNLEVNQPVYLDVLKSVLNNKDHISTESYLMVIKALPDYCVDPEKEKEIRKLILCSNSAEVKTHYYRKYEDCDLEKKYH